MPIQNSSVLTELNISCWTANAVDRAATNKTTADHGASHEAGLFRKNLMAGSSKRKEIADFAASCRLWHNTKTLPWADRGPRLLPTSFFLKYKQEANQRQQRFNELVDEFIAGYPTFIQLAQRALGSLFNPDEYPTIEEVREKFGFRLVFTPLPESGDFRLDIGNSDMEELRTQYDRAFEQRVADAMREPWAKMHEMLTGMVEKLDDDKAGGKIRRWHDSFVTNAQDLCGMLTHLNITGDPQLEEARRKLERAMRGVSMEDIKSDGLVRDDLKNQLDTILKDYW